MREALRLGAIDFIDKPFEPELVIEAVSKALELGHAIYSVETELKDLYDDEDLPEKTKTQLRKIKQYIVMMRHTINIYKK
jgi:FixJ family two-component response regulator